MSVGGGVDHSLCVYVVVGALVWLDCVVLCEGGLCAVCLWGL